MASDVVMPRLSDSMEEGTILKWLVSEGDEVKKGQEIVEIETDKANMTYEADTAGSIVELVASEGDTLALGEVIARIGDPSEKTEEKTEDGGQKTEEPDEEAQDDDSEGDGNGGAPEKEQEKKQPQSSGNGASAESDGRVKASPVAKRMAKE